MKVDNLEVGKKYGNYKVMCKVLEVDEKKGGSRTIQIEDWSRYFDYNREGNGYIIKEIYAEPKEKAKIKGGNNNIFGNITKLLIIDMLAVQEGRLSIGKTKLMRDLGIVNDNYNGCRSITAKLSSYLQIDIGVIYDFYNTNNSNFKKIIDRALNSLMDERRILYHTIFKVKEIGTYTYRVATKDETQTILNVEGNMLTKMGYASMSEIRVSKDWEEFQNVSSNIIKAMTDIDYYFDAYDITIHEERILKGREELLELILDKSKKEEYRKELNSLIINSINKNAINRHDKAKLIDNKNKKDKTRAKDNYVKDINTLSNVTTNLDYPNIVEIVNKEVINKKNIKYNKENKEENINDEMKEYVGKQLEGLFD